MNGSFGVLSSSAFTRREDASRAPTAPPMNVLLGLLIDCGPLPSLARVIKSSFVIKEVVLSDPGVSYLSAPGSAEVYTTYSLLELKKVAFLEVPVRSGQFSRKDQ